MSSLRALKLDENSLVFSSSEIFSLDPKTPGSRSDIDDVLTATRSKRYIGEQPRTRKTDGADSSSIIDGSSLLSISSDHGNKTRRAAGTRFPVKPSLGGLESFDASSGTPSLSVRTHYRDGSRQQGRPSTSPAQPGSQSSHRSESVHSTTLRLRRMGIVNDRAPDLSFLDGLAGTPHTPNIGSSSANSSFNAGMPPILNFSSLGEPTLATLMSEPHPDMSSEERLLLAAHRLVFTYRQLRPLALSVVQQLHIVHRAAAPELVSNLAEALESMAGLADFIALLEVADLHSDNDRPTATAKRLQSQCRLCFAVGGKLWAAFAAKSEEITAACPPGLIRTFTMTLFSILMEVRDTLAVLGIALVSPEPEVTAEPDGYQANNSTPMGDQKFGYSNQPYQSTPQFQTSQKGQQPTSFNGSFQSTPASKPDPSFESTLVPPPLSYLSNQQPHSMEVPAAADPSNDDAQFTQIYNRLSTAVTLAQSSIPDLLVELNRERDHYLNNAKHPAAPADFAFWTRLSGLFDRQMVPTAALNRKLATSRPQDPLVRQNPAFWSLIRTYCDAWYELVAGIQELSRLGPLHSKVRAGMKPLHRANKELILAIDESCWREMLSGPAPGGLAPHPHPPASVVSGHSGGSRAASRSASCAEADFADLQSEPGP